MLQFDDIGCMTGDGPYRDINLSQINNVIANWYQEDVPRRKG